MKEALNWLLGRALLYILLIFAIGFAIYIGPSLGTLTDTLSEDLISASELTERIDDLQNQRARNREYIEDDLFNQPAPQIRERIAKYESELENYKAQLAAINNELFASYRPTRIYERKSIEINIAHIAAKKSAFEAVLEPRAALERAIDELEALGPPPFESQVEASIQACWDAIDERQDHDRKNVVVRDLSDFFLDTRNRLDLSQQVQCTKADSLVNALNAWRKANERRIQAEAALSAINVEEVPLTFARDVGDLQVRDLAIKALVALLVITFMPLAIRLLFYYVLAPLAQSLPPIRLRHNPQEIDIPANRSQGVTLPVTLNDDEEILVRQGYLQTLSVAGEKRTQWLLSGSHPISSFVSGMRFLTCIKGAGEEVTISAVQDHLYEVAMLTIPKGASAVVRPSSIAAIVQKQNLPPRIEIKWRLFSIHAWLTFQFRFFVFHGESKIVLKGGRGVRIEPARQGRIFGQDQVIGFSTDLAYSVVRNETFAPYLFGHSPLYKDRVEGRSGVVLIEEAPLPSAQGVRRGLEGTFDAGLKAFGV